MVDISSVGTWIEVHFPASLQIDGLNGSTLVIKDFSEEGTPFDIGGGVDLTDNKKTLNGEMVSSRLPSVIPVNISVIPDGPSDRVLREICGKSFLSKGTATPVKDIIVEYMTIHIPRNNHSGHNPAEGDFISVSFAKGRVKTADLGPSTSGEGRKSARNYIFEFQGLGESDGSDLDDGAGAESN